jgi:hypothetical protein
MESEGTSRDDLDVRLHWPGAEPGEAAAFPTADYNNGAPDESTDATQPEAAVDAEKREGPRREVGSEPTTEVALGALQDAMRSISQRIDRLASGLEASQRAQDGMATQGAVIAAVERLERSIASLAETSASSDAKLSASVRQIHEQIHKEVHEDLARVTSRQADNLQRLEEISHQIEALRRRIALRARADHALSPEAIELIAEAVINRLSPSSAPAPAAAARFGRGARRK